MKWNRVDAPASDATFTGGSSSGSDGPELDSGTLQRLLDLSPGPCSVIDSGTGATLLQNAAGQAAEQQSGLSEDRARQESLGVVRAAKAAGGSLRNHVITVSVPVGGRSEEQCFRLDAELVTDSSGRSLCLVSYTDVTAERHTGEETKVSGTAWRRSTRSAPACRRQPAPPRR